MKREFEAHKLKPSTLEVIEKANTIIEEYERKGFDLTLRQLYYQMVSRGTIPNNLRSYKNLGVAINRGRMCGHIDWDAIVDRARSTVEPVHWDDPVDMLRGAAEVFTTDKWEKQPNHVEVMCEKDALSGVLEPICDELEVPFTANRGYSSQSFMYRKGRELLLKHTRGKKDIHLLYFGDHDPSGLDMDRDIEDRLGMFTGYVPLRVVRMALKMTQIEEFNPPPDPAKQKDSRVKAYISKYGPHSWELDALDPEVLQQLVEDEVLRLRDEELWDEALEDEREQRDKLIEFVGRYKG